MSSPFPGMDPFLEHPGIFPDLHDRFITYLSEALQPRLPEPYYAVLGRRVWVEITQRRVQPDVGVFRPGTGPSGEAEGGVAVASGVRAKPVVVRNPHDERREPLVEICTHQDGERMVTSIEVLSITNKTAGEQPYSRPKLAVRRQARPPGCPRADTGSMEKRRAREKVVCLGSDLLLN